MKLTPSHNRRSFAGSAIRIADSFVDAASEMASPTGGVLAFCPALCRHIEIQTPPGTLWQVSSVWGIRDKDRDIFVVLPASATKESGLFVVLPAATKEQT